MLLPQKNKNIISKLSHIKNINVKWFCFCFRCGWGLEESIVAAISKLVNN